MYFDDFTRWPFLRMDIYLCRGIKKYPHPGWLFFFFIFVFGKAFTQCPANLGFETGNFNNWVCFSGKIDSATGIFSTSETVPLVNRQTIFTNTYPQLKDLYGGFPINCPNGSNHSIRLGNSLVGGEIDGASYTFTIPADKNVYGIIYNYAVVFQDPNHSRSEQPRFTAKVFDVGTNKYIDCSSFDFSASANLPGFGLAQNTSGINSIFYKPWSPVTIKLIGYAGRTVKLEFTVNDCTLGGHFGYAYLDINEDCETPIGGNIVCQGAGTTLLNAPFGFKEYRWYDAGFTNLLGVSNTLRLSPAPVPNTVFAVEVRPYPGSGCIDTLYTSIERSTVPFLLKVSDTAGTCPPSTVDLTDDKLKQGSSSGLKYAYYADSAQYEYVPVPKAVDKSGRYYVKATNAAGCLDLRSLVVIMDSVPVVDIADPPISYYPNHVDITSPLLISGNTYGFTYSYWQDAAASIPLPKPKAIDKVGTYYIQVMSEYGCSVTKPVKVLFQIPPPPNAFSPNNDGINDIWEIPGLNLYVQCSVDIYDRNGGLIFHSIGYNKPWDGKINGKPLPVATYYYVIKISEKDPPVSGSITIVL